MRVSNGNNGFRPIAIVLETEEEAVAMWLRLNTPTEYIQEALEGDRLYNHDAVCGNFHSMFSRFDNAFRPTKEQ